MTNSAEMPSSMRSRAGGSGVGTMETDERDARWLAGGSETRRNDGSLDEMVNRPSSSGVRKNPPAKLPLLADINTLRPPSSGVKIRPVWQGDWRKPIVKRNADRSEHGTASVESMKPLGSV